MAETEEAMLGHGTYKRGILELHKRLLSVLSWWKQGEETILGRGGGAS